MTVQPLDISRWRLPRHLAARPADQTIREQAAVALRLVQDLSAALQTARLARGLTQAAAAQQAGICHTTWCHLEKGRMSPGAGTLRTLLDWLAADHHPDGYRPPTPPQAPAAVARLRRVRRQLGLTQHQVAQQIGVHKGAVSHWETGAVGIRATHLSALLAWLERHDPETSR